MAKKRTGPELLLCVRNDGYPASLEVRKVYQTLPDPSAFARELVRVIDESGKDYLFPRGYFVPIEVPPAAAEVFGV
jgi:hypothetical protein